MPFKLVLLGAGSQWGSSCCMDLATSPIFRDAEIVLVDIDASRLSSVERYGRRIAETAGLGQKVWATLDRETALVDATHVVVAVAVGGDECWRQDVRIPQAHGVYQSVGDTMGPGGLFRGLRHMYFLQKLTAEMERLCPRALLINLANPMNVLCRYLERSTPLKSIGLCHGIRDSKRILNEDEAKPLSVEFLAAGNNHFLFAVDVQIDGGQISLETLLARKPDAFWQRHGVIRDFWQRFGIFVINYDRHPAEFVPYYLREEFDWGEKLGFPRVPGEITQREAGVTDPGKELQRLAESTDPISIVRTSEPVADLIELETGARTGILHVNIPNRGAIPGLPSYGNVEMPAYYSGGHRFPLGQINLPGAVRLWVAHTCEVQELYVEAFLTRSRRRAITALAADALVRSTHIAERIFDELYAAQARYLPKFE